MKELKISDEYNNKTFEDIMHIDENGFEFWYARELMVILEYKQWRRFESVIDKAIQSCKNSGISAFEHFANVGKLSKRANNAEVRINDYKLSRYACYLIAQNGDSRKKVIALAQTYFAIQTRKQEKINDIIELVEKNPNSLNYLSLDRLEKIDKMYDERINSNKKKIEELQSSIKFVEESIKRAV